MTGTETSEGTISGFSLKGFPIKGSLQKLDLVPRDKFKLNNVIRSFKCMETTKQIDPTRLIFGNEKLLKGAEIHCQKARRHVTSGEMPEFLVNGDFQNACSIVGFCGTNRNLPPLLFCVHDKKNDLHSFSTAIVQAIAEDFLWQCNVLALDNAAIHSQGESTELVNWLWEEHGAAALFLPTHHLKLNPRGAAWQ